MTGVPEMGVARLLRGVAEGSLRPSETVSGARERLAAAGPRFNALVAPAPLAGRHPAAGPLAGLPIALKDCFFHHGRTPTMGSRVRPSAGRETAETVARLEGRGAVVVGYTNLHEWAVGGTSAVTATGPISNPWDDSLVAGGSSGGAAVAVATGCVPAALGTDAGGSIRIPAACCGIVGLKPTRSLVPTAGYVGDGGPTDHIGPMARSVTDVGIVLQGLVERPLDERPAASPRLGIATGVTMRAVEGAVGAGFEDAARLLTGISASALEVNVDDFPHLARANARLFLADTAARVRAPLDATPELFQPPTLRVLERARAIPAAALEEAVAIQRDANIRWAALFEEIDVLLTPTLPILPPSIEEATSRAGDVEAALGSLSGAMNLTGYPALSLPCADAGGLTVNVTLTAAPGHDGWLLALGRALEDATERRWVGRVAPL